MALYTYIQGVSEKHVLILASVTHQFINLFPIAFCKIRKNFPKFFAPNFYHTSRFV
jgi:hypothetical protein